jgi:TP901 family phage tail tape measure protein
MSTRSVVVRLEAEVSKFVRGQQQAKQATDETAKAQEQLSKAVDAAAAKQAAGADKVAASNKKVSQSSEESANSSKRSSQASEDDAKAKQKQADAADKVGKTMLTFGTATVAGLGASAKAAMDWESAWAGVTKTVDGTPEQMQEIEDGLRNLAKTLPSTHEEIAAVAESAGALGVKREDIIQFTKTMVDLGETTNLSADEAATAIAQLLNVMGDAGGEVDNLGSTLVALGNDGASTEKEILMMAQRISGAGKLIGASKPDVMALASTLASLGVQAELGGGVTSRVMQRMYTDVKTGGEGLQKLAKVAGVSGAEFAKAFETSPVRAMDMVFQGLNKVKTEGGNVVQTMADIGIKGTEETGVVLRLAGAGDILAHSLEVGNKAWTENSALAAEASKRYETTESKVKVAWNNIKDAAIDAGAVLLPIIQTIAESVAGLAQGWEALPKPVQNTVTVLAGVAGVASLVVGGLLTVIPKVKETADAFREFNTRTDGSSRGLDKWGKAAGVATAAIVGMAVVGSISDSLLPSTETAEQLASRLINVSNGVKSADDAFDKSAFTRANAFIGTTNEINNIGDAINRVVNPGTEGFRDWINETFPIASSQIKETKDVIKGVDQQLATLYTSGNSQGAAKAFKDITDAAAKHNVSLEDVVKLYPNYRDAVSAAGRESSGAALSQEELNKRMLEAPAASSSAAESQKIVQGALEDTGVNLNAVVEDMEKFLSLLFATGMATMSARDANAAYNDAIRGVDEAVKTITESGGKMGAMLNANKTDFDLTTEAGSLANSAFQKIARGGMTEVEAMSKEGLGQDALQAKLNTTYKDLVTAALGMGISKDAAEALTRKVLGVPDGVTIESWMSEAAKTTAEKTKSAMDAIDGRTVRTYTLHEEKTIKSIVTQISQQNMGETPADTAFKPGTFAPARATGGRVPAYAGGGRIDYPQPTDITKDNVMGLIDGEPAVTLQGREWVINGRSSDEYDRELAAINAGTFPKYFGGTTASTSIMAQAPVGLAAASGPMSFTGQLVLDSGEFLGTVRGIATQEINGSLNNAARTAGGRR